MENKETLLVTLPLDLLYLARYAPEFKHENTQNTHKNTHPNMQRRAALALALVHLGSNHRLAEKERGAIRHTIPLSR